MKKTVIRVFAMLLCLVAVIGLLPKPTAHAATSGSSITFNVRKPSFIKKGNSFDLRGEINSKNRIVYVYGCIIRKNTDTVVQSSHITPYHKIVNIGSSSINAKLRFGQLSRGTYILRITAVDGKGISRSMSTTFKVV